MTTRLDRAFSDLERPFAWLDLDALDKNIRTVQEACGGKQIRIATKSIRSVEVLRYVQKNLANVVGFMTFTAAETIFLLQQQFDDLLLGYPVMEEAAIRRLLHFVKDGKSVTFMVDRPEHIQLLAKLGLEIGVRVQVCIDINVSNDFKVLYFGTKRSSLYSLETLTPFLQEIQKTSAIEVVGAMGYEAQIAGVGNRPANALKGKVIEAMQVQAKKQVTQFRRLAIAHIKAYFPNLRFVNGGGSGSMLYTNQQKEVTEITVGSAFYAPALFDQFTHLQLEKAAGFALSVTRKPEKNIVVCHGGGYTASGAIGLDRLPVFYEPSNFAYLSLEGAGEVQTPIKVKGKHINIGDTIYFRHAKAGELCERFQVLHGIREDKYMGPYTTYRGDGQCFL
ncbi:MAG TPA: amino acid deaminase/aldolase [Lysinibacillus sp.]|jgi:D-serine deaminase-like pyridoxal phosphate-dependent protein|uniref:amino acid deaminase/aldolase n=1 Tax=Lysinibacillus TaxID=400634 RepID=UPI0005629A26|nr:amino acid deaminase/aldolase [Lysinibacillus sphaericus]MEE3806204.1 amino acid deaminase/aldolase [Lysinibacillus fusiformis]HBT72793.1 amino acid deaminase/aldolase [Lysinibacillus sp.]